MMGSVTQSPMQVKPCHLKIIHNYANTELETRAVVQAMGHFHKYLYGYNQVLLPMADS